VKLVFDHHFPALIAREVEKQLGIRCLTVAELHWSRATDYHIFSSLSDRGDVIVTKDEDYVAMATRSGPPPQVIWIRLGNIRNSELLVVMRRSLPSCVEHHLSGAPVVELTRH
jgi:predicted nuclease of predicted toxin-antitoxin system